MQQNPQEVSDFPGYFEIPGYSRYAVSRDGKVLNKLTGVHLEGSTNPDGYHNFRLTGDTGYTLTWGRHRLLGFVFKNPGCSIDGLTVNHENGIKGDDRLENLEWMTQQEQQEHAGRTGLTSKCVPIAVRDVDTGEVIEYASAIKYAMQFNMSKDAILYRIKIGPERVFPERKQYRRACETGEWPIPDDIERALLANGTHKSVLLRYVMLEMDRGFYDLTELSVYLDMPLSTLSTWINKPGQPVLPGFIQLKWADDPTPWRIVDDPYLDLEAFTGQRAVVVCNTITKTKSVHISAVECANARGVLPTTLNNRLKSNGSKVYSDGCTYAYYADSL